MDPITTDPPPITTDHFPGHPPPATTHPPYAEMITAAITALKDKDGSSRQAISKYIEKEFAHLPPTHSTLLTHHLKRLKNLGQLVMVKHSYMLASRSAEFVDFSGNVTDASFASGGFNSENSGSGSKRKPGRPPKLKPVPGFGVHNQVQNADVAAYQPQFQDFGGSYGSGSEVQGGTAAGSGSEPLFASLGLGDDGVAAVEPVVASENVNTNTPVVVKRGRGRPPKSASASGGQAVVSGSEVQGQVAGTGSDGGGGVQGVEVALGRPGRKANGVRVKRGRGRPKRIGFGAVTVPLSGNLLRPRGRPKRAVRQKVTAVNGGAGLVGKSFGSISKGGPGTAVLVTDPEQLVVYQELKSKYEHLQSKVKQVASMVKSCIDPDFGNTALGALQELEDLAAEVNGGARGQTHEPATAS
ncbi:putative linker histone H1/H5, domain H15, AT hook, DNA-binding protein [Helianthus annuus]|nr:putative linker histone H1/H5, domain H15, AT hook, DNA-binding protein [Helianthus annuus]KAJ0484404.1 putative linker histone H1/H5, domain H15, AT hook, DNA-binding protein [Helianthus annuus]KAJ0654956.1 putative linker histone H1/H5, domain H15, AT hook, DNA-binding protein [Helianthus annuus]KAJ0658675.1 putative linker histone H1/H5, domain H15, AT hook, DNA-binding protein [Helianthus annuus]